MPATRPPDSPVVHRARAPLIDVELRTDPSSTGDGSWTFHGHAAVTNQTTTLYEGRSWVWRERIAPGAFRDVLDELQAGSVDHEVVLNHEHDNRAVLAATGTPPSQVGGLELREDGTGLAVFARLDPADPDTQRVVPKIKRGNLRQMSFAFTPGEFQTVTEEDDQGRVVETDTILSVRSLWDVTVCAHGAYPTTSAGIDIRGLLAASGRSGFDPEGPHVGRGRGTILVPGLPDATSVAPPTAGAVENGRALRLAKLRARAAVAVHQHNRS
jgi:HK97 family phage prohead protease